MYFVCKKLSENDINDKKQLWLIKINPNGGDEKKQHIKIGSIIFNRIL